MKINNVGGKENICNFIRSDPNPGFNRNRIRFFSGESDSRNIRPDPLLSLSSSPHYVSTIPLLKPTTRVKIKSNSF